MTEQPDVTVPLIEISPRMLKAFAEIEALRARIKASLAELELQTAELRTANDQLRQAMARLERKGKR